MLKHTEKQKKILLLKTDIFSGGTPALEKALAGDGELLSYSDGVQLMNEENLFLLAAAADKIRSKFCGDTVTFVASYYLMCVQPAVHCVPFTEKATKMMPIHCRLSR
jgi:hypothetical protein